MEKIRRIISLPNCFVINSIGRRGGLVLLWHDEIDLEIVKFLNYHINSKILVGTTGIKWFLIGFYGSPKMGKKGRFLGSIRKNQSWAIDWLVCSR